MVECEYPSKLKKKLKVKNISTQQSTSKNNPIEIFFKFAQRYMYKGIHDGIFHNERKLETH